MKANKILLLLPWFFFPSVNCSGSTTDETQNPPKEKTWASATDMNRRLGKGINIGNTFEAMPSWQSAFDPADIKRIADLGFTHIRLPIRWERDDRSLSSAPYTIKPAFLATIRAVVDEALKQKLHIVINMHHHDALYADPDGQKNRFLAQWQQISTYFKDYPDSLLFEILNEPHDKLTAPRWNTFSKEALQTIRATNPKRCVLLGTADWGGVAALKSLEIPTDPHLILSIHYYNPFHFTHQGADWVEGADAWLGTKWNDTEYERKAVQEDFKPAMQLSKEKNIPIHVGEFGAYSQADPASRILWTQYLARWFDAQGFSWAYWEWNSGFGIYNPKNGTYNTGLVNALIHNTMPAPHQTSFVRLYSSNFSNAGNDGWNLYNNDASASATLTVAENKASIGIAKQGAENWHIQFIRGGFDIQRTKTYLILFNAYLPDGGAKEIYVNVSKAAAPWTSYAGQTLQIGGEEARHEFLFTPSESDAHARMVFSVGNAGIPKIVFSNIELNELVQ